MGIHVLLGPFGPPGDDDYPTDKQLEGAPRTCLRGLQASILDHGEKDRILRGFCEWWVYPLRPRFGQPAALRHRGGGVRVRSVGIARHAIYGPQELLEVAGVLAEVSLAKP